MAKYEIEIDDATARRWSRPGLLMDPDNLDIDVARVESALVELVRRYGDFPQLRDKHDEAAMAICRGIAAERAAAYGNRERGTEIDRAAEDVLRFMLGGL